MAVLVVDLFEVIDIQRHCRVALVEQVELFEGQLEAAAVTQAGQRVGHGRRFQCAHLLLQQGDACEHRDLQSRDLEIPGVDHRNTTGCLRCAPVFGGIGQGANGPGDEYGQPPEHRERDKRERYRVEQRGPRQLFELRGDGCGRTLGDDAPAGALHGREAGEHVHAERIDDALAALLARQHLPDHRIARYVLADPLAVFVEDQSALCVDHVQVGAVAVVMHPQQAVQCVALAQEQRRTDEAEVAAIGGEDGVGDRDQVSAVRGDVGIAGLRYALFQRAGCPYAVHL